MSPRLTPYEKAANVAYRRESRAREVEIRRHHRALDKIEARYAADLAAAHKLPNSREEPT